MSIPISEALGFDPVSDRLKESILSDMKEGKQVFQIYKMYQVVEAVGDENFAALLKNTAHKRTKDAFETWPATWQMIVNKPFGNRPDFKLNTVIEIEEAARLSKVSKKEQTPMDTIGERSLTYKVDSYESGYQINRQDIINDDLGQFMRFPAKFGRAAQRTIDKFVWDFINDNATLGFDDTALFHANHANLNTTTPLSTDGLTKLKSKLRLQTEPKTGDVLNLKGELLIVPPTLEDRAQQIVTAGALAETANNDGNPHKNLKILVVPWLTDTGNPDTCDWYLAASPSQIETIQIDFLKGMSEPQTLRAIPNSPDGYDFLTRNMAFKTRYEFGGDLMEYRWIQKGDAA